MADKTNQLLGALPQRERRRILDQCETVDLTFGAVLCEQRETYAWAHFPMSGLISLLAGVDQHAPMELAMVGDEGMLGASMVLDVTEAPQKAIVQADGTALRIPAIALQDVLIDCPVLRHALERYLFEQLIQLSQSTVCTRFHLVEARLARWLLMTQDRIRGDRILLTHQFLADMLGVQRGAVTIASGTLKSGGLIDYARGEIRILDRRGLQSASCCCYEAIAA